MTVEIVAVISPTADKSDLVETLLKTHAEYVKQNEPGCLRYQLYRQANGKDVVMVET